METEDLLVLRTEHSLVLARLCLLLFGFVVFLNYYYFGLVSFFRRFTETAM